jgi:hypothetical protein
MGPVLVAPGTEAPDAHFTGMVFQDPELQRLRLIEQKACALRDRLRASARLLSDPSVLKGAEDLCAEAREAISHYLKRLGDPT